jgi:hypothetical protein
MKISYASGGNSWHHSNKKIKRNKELIIPSSLFAIVMNRFSLQILLIFLMPLLSDAQKLPIDTSFYLNGNIEAIKYKEGERWNGYATIRYFKKSANILDANQPYMDTIFRNDINGKKEWTWYDGSTRIFIPGNSNITISRGTKWGSNKDPIYQGITGSYCFLFKELGDVEFRLSYNRDSNIINLTTCIYDTIQQGFSFKEIFSHIFFDSKKGANMNSDSLFGNLFDYGKHGVAEVFFEKNLIKKFCFYPNDTLLPRTYYEFYETLLCKKYGHFKGNQIPFGECYEYHPNGNVNAFGSYKINESGSEKDGLWKYYNTNGELIRKEWYDGGKLIKTKSD